MNIHMCQIKAILWALILISYVIMDTIEMEPIQDFVRLLETGI